MIILFSMFMWSCDQQSDDLSAVVQQEMQIEGVMSQQARAVTSTTYYSTPSVGGYTPNSSSAVVVRERCGANNGGLLKAKLERKVGNMYTARLSLQRWFPYINNGNAYIKANSVCGDISGYSLCSGLTNTSDYVDVSFTPSFITGVQHFYPLIISGSYREYAEPILIHTTPMYNSNWGHNNVLGTVNGVEVRCNGATNYSIADWATNQCVEFCQRYYLEVYGETLGSFGGAAKYFFGRASNNSNLEAITNGQKSPRPGDILCLDGGPADANGNTYGHVAIIVEVGWNYVKVAHQNTGTSGGFWLPIGGELAYNSSTKQITTPKNYRVQGWVRMNRTNLK